MKSNNLFLFVLQALTTYEKTYDGTYTRRSVKQQRRQDVYLPVHLYGQLVQHKSGYQYLDKQVRLKVLHIQTVPCTFFGPVSRFK